MIYTTGLFRKFSVAQINETCDHSIGKTKPLTLVSKKTLMGAIGQNVLIKNYKNHRYSILLNMNVIYL